MVIFHSYVSLPEGKHDTTVHGTHFLQRATRECWCSTPRGMLCLVWTKAHAKCSDFVRFRTSLIDFMCELKKSNTMEDDKGEFGDWWVGGSSAWSSCWSKVTIFIIFIIKQAYINWDYIYIYNQYSTISPLYHHYITMISPCVLLKSPPMRLLCLPRHRHPPHGPPPSNAARVVALPPVTVCMKRA